MPDWRAMASKTAAWATAAVNAISTHLCLRLDGAYPQELPPLGDLDLEQVLVEGLQALHGLAVTGDEECLQCPARGCWSEKHLWAGASAHQLSEFGRWHPADTPNQGKHGRCNRGAGTSRGSRLDSNTGLVGPSTCGSRPGSMLPKHESGAGCVYACVCGFGACPCWLLQGDKW